MAKPTTNAKTNSKKTNTGKAPMAQKPAFAKVDIPKNSCVCIICQRERDGYAVREDFIIRGIRAVKRALRAATNNRLVVCKDCVDAHRAKRASFERKLMLYGGFGILLVIVFTLLSQTLQGFAASLMLGIFVAALALFSYHPGSEAK
jgi:hypothetical protein